MAYPRGEMPMSEEQLKAMGIKPEEMTIGKSEGLEQKPAGLSRAIDYLEKGELDKAFDESTQLDAMSVTEMAQRFRNVDPFYADILVRRAERLENIQDKIARSRKWTE